MKINAITIRKRFAKEIMDALVPMAFSLQIKQPDGVIMPTKPMLSMEEVMALIVERAGEV